jgi:hypothetical protein
VSAFNRSYSNGAPSLRCVCAAPAQGFLLFPYSLLAAAFIFCCIFYEFLFHGLKRACYSEHATADCRVPPDVTGGTSTNGSVRTLRRELTQHMIHRLKKCIESKY